MFAIYLILCSFPHKIRTQMATQSGGRQKSKLPETRYSSFRLTIHSIRLLDALQKLEGLRRGAILENAIREHAEKKGIKLTS